MNDYISYEIIKSFNIFRKLLENGINNNNISSNDNECYLIDNKWYNELEKNIRDNENIKNKNRKPKVCLSQQLPNFINDIDKAIELLKSNNGPKLISKYVLHSIYKNENLKSANIVKYIYGFNNLIIKFIGKEYNNGLFLFSPLNKNKTKNIIFSFKFKNKKKENYSQLYSNLLKMKNSLSNNLLNDLVKKKEIEKYEILKDKEEISHGTEEYIDDSNENT